jgi:hypothetical protein
MAKTAGDRLVDGVLADLESQGLRPDSREVALLERARHAADRIAELESVLRINGSTYFDKDGLARPSPLLNEIRQQAATLARVLSGVQMTAPSESKNVAKQRAGRASWAAAVAREAAGRNERTG